MTLDQCCCITVHCIIIVCETMQTSMPIQSNGVDCGLFTILGMDLFSTKSQFNFSQKDIPFARRYVAYEMIKTIKEIDDLTKVHNKGL